MNSVIQIGQRFLKISIRSFPRFLHIVCLLVFACFLLTALYPAEGWPNSNHTNKKYTTGQTAFYDGNLDELRNVTDEVGTLSVIVKLNADYTPEGRLSTSDVKQQRGSIAKVQNDLLDQLQATNFTLSHQYKSSPFLAGKITTNEVDILEHNNRVDKVYIDQKGGLSLQKSIPHVGADKLHARDIGGTGGMIVIMDSGIDDNHPAFQNRVRAEACFSRGTDGLKNTGGDCPNGESEQFGDPAGRPLSLSGDSSVHGSHVAGIAAGDSTAVPDPDLPVGVANEAGIASVMIFHDDDGEALYYQSDLIAGLEYVSNTLADSYNVKSVNMSINGPAFKNTCDNSSPIKPIIDTLRSQRIAPIVSTGNDGETDTIIDPACVSSSIAVGSVSTNSDSISFFSNRDTDMVDLMAPGDSVYSAIPNQQAGFLSGTSMAAPHVAGSWALLGQGRDIKVDKIEESLISTGKRIQDPDSSSDAYYRSIRVDSAFAVSTDIRAQFDFEIDTPTIGETVTFNDQSMNVSTGPITAWKWSFGDGDTSSKQSPDHRYDTVGTYNVRLTVSNGFSQDTTSRLISINIPPETKFSYNPLRPDIGETVTFSDTSLDPSGSIAERIWDFGDGTVVNGQTPDHSYGDSGVYEIKLIVKDDMGETAETRKLISVGEIYPITDPEFIESDTRPSDTTGFIVVSPRSQAVFSQVSVEEKLAFDTVTDTESIREKSNSTCNNTSATYSFPLLNTGKDTLTVCVWTNQSRFSMIYNTRSDTETLDQSVLPNQLPGNDTGIRTLSNTVFSLKFGDSTGTLLGDTDSTQFIGNQFAYTLKYELSQNTLDRFRKLNIDPSDLRFYFSESYADTWSKAERNVSVNSTPGSPGQIVTVAGLTTNSAGGLGGPGSDGSGGGSGGCMIESMFGSDSAILDTIRKYREYVISSKIGRWFTNQYYEWLGDPGLK